MDNTSGLSMELELSCPPHSFDTSGVEAAEEELTMSGLGHSLETVLELLKDVEPPFLGSRAGLVSVCAEVTVDGSGPPVEKKF